MKRYPIIEFILYKKENEIINIMNYLPKINLFINKIYNEKLFSISREEAENETINVLNLNEGDINNFKENISKFINNYKISKNSKILEVLNIKDNKIYKLYDNIIKKYNQFLSKLTIYNNNKDVLPPLIVQNYYKQISLFKNPEEGLNELKKIISIYSNRNRLITDDKNYKLNIYNGDKLDYDFQLIENILEKKNFIDNSIFEQKQLTFIFSNNVFSDDRNNLLKEIMEKFPQKPIKQNKNFIQIESDDKDANLRIYHDLLFIIINLQSLLTNNEKENISFKDISKMISKKYGYEINESLHLDDIYVDNILAVYEKYEEICFQYFKEILIPKKHINEKDKAIKDTLNNLELIKNDVICKATKKYFMRYCLGDYDKKENILKNMKIDKMLLKKDIWEEKIFINPKFKEESEFLNKLNIEKDNYLDKYFLYNIINGRTNEEKEDNKDNCQKNKNNNDNKDNKSEDNILNEIDSENDSQKSENDRPSMFENDRPSMFEDDRPSMFENDRPSMFENDRPSIFEDDRPSTFENDRPSTFENDRDSIYEKDFDIKNDKSRKWL